MFPSFRAILWPYVRAASTNAPFDGSNRLAHLFDARVEVEPLQHHNRKLDEERYHEVLRGKKKHPDNTTNMVLKNETNKTGESERCVKRIGLHDKVCEPGST